MDEGTYEDLKQFAEENWGDKNNTYITFLVDNDGWTETCFICSKDGKFYEGSIDNECINDSYDTLDDLFEDQMQYDEEEPYEFKINQGEIENIDEMIFNDEDSDF